MLSKNAILASASIVDQFNLRRMAILPIPGTPVAALCTAMAPGDTLPENIDDLQQLSAEQVMEVNIVEPGVVNDADKEEVGYDPEYDSPEDVVTGSQQVAVHDAVMEASVQDLARKINFAKQQAREVILPACRNIFAEIEKRVDDLIYAPRLVPIVVMSEYPDWYNSVQFMAEIEGRAPADEADRSYVPSIDLAPIPGQYLRNALVIGNPDMDVLVAQAVEGVSDTALEDIYNHFFRGSMLTELKDTFLLIDDLGVGFQGNRNGALPALLCWVWAKSLYDDVQEGNRMSLNNYQAKMLAAQATAFNGMQRVNIDRLNRQQEGQMILKSPSLHQIRVAEDASELQIIVNGDVYLDYLRNGGSPEALTGAVLSERIDMLKDDLLKANIGLMTAYTDFVELKAIQQNANRLHAYGLALRSTFGEVIADEEDKEPKEAVLAVAISNLVDTDIANIQPFIRRLYVNLKVADGAQTINRLIDEIDSEMRSNPELTVFEAATKAQVNVLSDYVAQQFYVLEV